MPATGHKTQYDHDTMSMITTGPSAEKVARDISFNIDNDYDGKVREALIGLGWHPPIDTTGDAALWQLAEDRTPSDVVEGAKRWGLAAVLPFLWRSAFVAGWRAAMVVKNR